MAKITVACMMRNEANRFLRSALDSWATFADCIVVLDDGSDDTSHQIALAHGRGKTRVYDADWSGIAWGSESAPRAALWKLALENTEPGGFVFILDADMVPARDPRPLFDNPIDSVAFALYDLWGTVGDGRLLYREDDFWQGHFHPRVWAVRKPAQEPADGWTWNERGIHCGHFPENLMLERTFLAPREYALLHYGFFDDEIRAEKAERYSKETRQLSPFEREHAASILEPFPRLRLLPFEPTLTLQRPNHAYAL